MNPDHANQARADRGLRGGFTLIELLVVMGILLTIATLTAAAINVSYDVDQARAAARQVQSYLEGARDRAISAKEGRGVRFILDPQEPRLVKSMVYIRETPDFITGTINLSRADGLATATVNGVPILDLSVAPAAPGAGPYTQPVVVVEETLNIADYPAGVRRTPWELLFERNLLSLEEPVLIKIPDDESGNWYTASCRLLQFRETPSRIGPKLVLGAPLAQGVIPTQPSGIQLDPQQYTALYGSSYRLRLPPIPLERATPTQLPSSMVIDLDQASLPFVANGILGASPATTLLPSSWLVTTSTDPRGFQYSGNLDILFSPRGTVIGKAATRATIHLPIVSRTDGAVTTVGSNALFLVPPLSAAAWSDGVRVAFGACVVPQGGGGLPNRTTGFVYQAIASTGPTGTSQPTWPTTPGQTVTDGGVTWKTFRSTNNGNTFAKTERLLVSIQTKTGAVNSAPIYYAGPNERPDPFRYSETGETAGK